MDSIPNDFGMDRVRTYAHVGDPTPARDHSVFWNAWFERLSHESPVLRVREQIDESDASATHEFISSHGVRIGCRLLTPPEGTLVRASLVTVHGYTVPDSLEHESRRWSAVCDQGVAVLVIRLRGFPGSRTDGSGNLIDIDATNKNWITQGFNGFDHKDWVLPDALADVCNAARVMRNALLGRDAKDLEPWLEGEPRHPDVYLHGRSLGGGLATIAAAQLSGRMLGRPIVDRLAIEVPSLGAWRWRLEHGGTGLSERFKTLIENAPDHRDDLIGRLRLMDAVVHSRKVRVPTLAMLACRDEVAPAPSAAAVFNAIDADPGNKWRFCVPYGHYSGDTHNTRRIATFGRVLNDFFDPSRLPMDSLDAWESEMCLTEDS
ncbi:MAG: alpha/beta fold hydrolase [Phycisphaerales bacterium]|nr:alpha/beta fold hydrolase [Phycisphaerales bacterium]